MSGKKATVWIIFVWILSFVSPVYSMVTGTIDKLSKIKYGILATVIVLTAITYAITCASLKKQAKNLENMAEGPAYKAQVTSEKRFLNTLIIVAAVAVICLTPATVYNLEKPGLDPDVDKNIVDCVLMTILATNFAVNPVIYFLRLKNYRKTFLIVFCGKK